MKVKHISKKRWSLIPFFSLRTWWRRRKFQYLVHIDVPEERTMSNSGERSQIAHEFGTSALEAFNAPIARHPEDEISIGINSYYDSIESMDSIGDSYYIHSEEDHSKSVEYVDEFLMEHLNFLSQSTQPQDVELVYNAY